MKLYMHPVSTTSRPVMLFASEAGIPLDLEVVDLMTGAHHSDAYKKINPNCLVPVLQDEDFTLTESSSILKYLANKVDSPLYPKDLKARARVNERMDWFNTNFYRDYGYNLIYPQIYPHHKRPNDDVTAGTIDWGKAKVEQTMAVLDKHYLANSTFVAGDEMTIADIFGAELVSAGEIIGINFAKWPNVNRWMAKMKELKSWNIVNEGHDGFAASLKDTTFVTA